MICFVNFTLSEKYFSMQRKALSIRDILNIIEFIQTNTVYNKFTVQPLTYPEAFRHAIELVIVDGVCLGIDIAGDSEKLSIIKDCY